MYTAKTSAYGEKIVAQGATIQEARKALRDALERASESWTYVDRYDEPVSEARNKTLRTKEVRDLMDNARVILTVDDIDVGRWEEDQYHAGFGNRSLYSTDVKIGRRRWHIEIYTDADGDETITACPASAMQAAAARSYQAGGGVRGLCMSHVDPEEVITLTWTDNLLEVLG